MEKREEQEQKVSFYSVVHTTCFMHDFDLCLMRDFVCQSVCMEDLLRRQPAITLILWLEERGVVPSDDPVKNVMKYYEYIDVLCLPTNDVDLSSSITMSDDIMSRIFSACDERLVRFMRCVCRSWLRTAPETPKCTPSIDMDWRSMPRILDGKSQGELHCYEIEAARNGIILIVTSMGMDISEFVRLLLTGTSKNRYRMFTYCWDVIKSKSYCSDVIVNMCIEGGDPDMFNYIQEDLHKNERGTFHYRYQALRLNRVEMIRVMFEYELRNCTIPQEPNETYLTSGLQKRPQERMREISILQSELCNRQSRGIVISQWLMAYTSWLITAGPNPNPNMVEFFESIVDMEY